MAVVKDRVDQFFFSAEGRLPTFHFFFFNSHMGRTIILNDPATAIPTNRKALAGQLVTVIFADRRCIITKGRIENTVIILYKKKSHRQIEAVRDLWYVVFSVVRILKTVGNH